MSTEPRMAEFWEIGRLRAENAALEERAEALEAKLAAIRAAITLAEGFANGHPMEAVGSIQMARSTHTISFGRAMPSRGGFNGTTQLRA